MQIKLDLSWVDFRLRFANLLQKGNQLSSEQKAKLWIPKVKFLNTKEELTEFFDDNNSSATINIRENVTGAEGVKIPDDEPFNGLIYDGRGAEISVSKFFLIDFICQFQMRTYHIL